MKIVTAKEAAAFIHDRMTVGVSGFGSYSAPDELLEGVERQYAEYGHPSDLTIFSTICTGDFSAADIGHNRLKAKGLIDTIIAAHFRNSSEMDRLVGENEVAGYTLPMGVNVNLLRAAAAKKPGIITRIGLHTYIDPRIEGCAINEKAKQQNRQLVSTMELDGKDYLYYSTVPLDVCLIRGSFADEAGNISMRREAIVEVQLEMAMATHANGGTVIVQVEDIVKRGTLSPKEVRIPACLVDYVVKAKHENHLQSFGCTSYHPELTGEVRCPVNAVEPRPLNLRKIIARRAVLELTPNLVINLGIGIPSGVGSVANEEGLAESTTLSLESGPLGGVPLEGVGFGGAANPEAIVNIADNFDLYDGGGLDMAFLGAAEIDESGNVNVSRFGTRCAGPGGFIDITQSTHKVCFLGGFTATKPKLSIGNGELKILEDGTGIKFVKKAQQVTFSANFARETGQEILYITERAVFRLTEEGIMLTEVAPGVDVQKDILEKMEFTPFISKNLKAMDTRLFQSGKMGLTIPLGNAEK